MLYVVYTLLPQYEEDYLYAITLALKGTLADLHGLIAARRLK